MDLNQQNYGQREKQPNKHDWGAFLGGLTIGIFSTLLLVCAVLLVIRFWTPKNERSKADNGDVSDQTVSRNANGILTAETADKINQLVSDIHKNFYLRDVTDEELTVGIYKGIMEALDDPYSVYYTPEEFEELLNSFEGVYYGIGAYISLDNETSLPKISGVIKGTPAEETGLRNNDLIYKVDGTETYGMQLEDAVKMIKGDENTQVLLTLIREGKQMDVSVTRRKVETPTVNSEMLENGMGYLQIVSFDDVTLNQFLNAKSELEEAGMKGLILDLRANPGGNLDTVVDIARNLLPEGLVVYTEDKKENRRDYKCKGDKEIKIPMVVLVDMNSASAAEILAGAIQDHKKGTLIGTTTFGKGIVQSVIPNSKDGSAIKITVSSYFTPNGRNIHKIGIEPDIVCEFDAEKYYDEENPVDTQLEKAKEVLAEMMK